MKSHGLFVYHSPPSLLFSSIKVFSFLCPAGTCTWLPWLQTPNCSSLLIPSRAMFAGEVFGSLFVSGQHTKLGCVRDMSSFIAHPPLRMSLFFRVNNDLSFEETNYFLNPVNHYRCYLNSLCLFHTEYDSIYQNNWKKKKKLSETQYYF